MIVRDLMRQPAIVVSPAQTLDGVARTMLRRGASCAVVVDPNGRATGILTERDFTAREPSNPFQRFRPPSLFGHPVRLDGLEATYAEARHITAASMQRPLPIVLDPNDPLERAVDAMNRHEVQNLVVVRDGVPIGTVSRHELLRLAAGFARSGEQNGPAVVARPLGARTASGRPPWTPARGTAVILRASEVEAVPASPRRTTTRRRSGTSSGSSSSSSGAKAKRGGSATAVGTRRRRTVVAAR